MTWPASGAATSRGKALIEQSKIKNQKSKIHLSSLASAPTLHSIRAVTFDVGGTLIEPWPSVGHVYAEVAARHGWRGLSVPMLNRRFAEAWGALKSFNYTRSEWAAVVEATFRGVIEGPPSRALFDDLYARFGRREAWRIFDDVVPTLETLAARGLRLGVISNWDERLRPLLRRLKLLEYFDTIVVSCEAGAAKPSGEIFALAAEKLALPREKILHVGDSPALDTRGARAARLQAVLLRRGVNRAAAGQIRSLLQLCEFCFLSRPKFP
jgi:putative hydrolase of the HAD superfamily